MARIKTLGGKKIRFQFDAPGAKEVMVVGDFNNWDTNSTPLRRTKGSLWQKEVTLKSGRYEYKFVVDGNWILDSNNNNRVFNSFGTENSVLEL
ncbi:MAG: isoamylase early set domain-containing protein [Candidatus Omnitrophica bacterium]|nr:isoamylase early set domain-containing protein [Candidatus Omnitrophota bacterium]